MKFLSASLFHLQESAKHTNVNTRSNKNSEQLYPVYKTARASVTAVWNL
jgi:hypothetical protein